MSDDTPKPLEPGEFRIVGEPVTRSLAEHGPKLVSAPVTFELEPRGIGQKRAVGHIQADPHYTEFRGRQMLAAAALNTRVINKTDLKGKSTEGRILALGDATFADLLWMAFYRIASGDGGKVYVGVDTRCDGCHTPINGRFIVDFNTVQVFAYEELPRITYRLMYPWRVLGREVGEVTLQEPAASSYLPVIRTRDWEIDFEFRRVAASIRALDGTPLSVPFEAFMMHDKELGRALHSDDHDAIIEALNAADARRTQPKFPCPNCGADVIAEVSPMAGFF